MRRECRCSLKAIVPFNRNQIKIIGRFPVFLFALFSCAFYINNCKAQEKNYIIGTVLNGESDAAISNVSVFITNTSRGTVSAANGSFRLSGIPAGKYDLIISSVGYTTQVYSFSSDKLPLNLKIYLELRATELETVIVEPYEKDGWEKWGSFFIENFIGTTEAAKLCKIRNYKTLRFRNSKKKNTLTAVAAEPLIIENRELGYKITYQLEEFSYDFNKQTLSFLGYTLFEDMATDIQHIPKRFLRERRKVYNGSIVHFMRSLYLKQIEQNGFEVKRVTRLPNTEKERVKALIRSQAQRQARPNPDSSTYFNRILRQDDYQQTISDYNLTDDSLVSATDNGQMQLYFDNFIQVTYKNGIEEPGYLEYAHERRKLHYPRSIVFLQNGNPLTVEKNGSYAPPSEFFSSGYWAWSEKISHLLPTDYDNAKGH